MNDYRTACYAGKSLYLCVRIVFIFKLDAGITIPEYNDLFQKSNTVGNKTLPFLILIMLIGLLCSFCSRFSRWASVVLKKIVNLLVVFRFKGKWGRAGQTTQDWLPDEETSNEFYSSGSSSCVCAYVPLPMYHHNYLYLLDENWMGTWKRPRRKVLRPFSFNDAYFLDEKPHACTQYPYKLPVQYVI